MKIISNSKSLFVFIFLFSIFVSITYYFINLNHLPSTEYLQVITEESIQDSNNFTWETYTGTEGEKYFTKSSKIKYFGSAVDLTLIKNNQIVSEGKIENFIESKVPSIKFRVSRIIKEKDNKVTKYWEDIEYIFKFEDNKWLIDKVNLLNSSWG